MSAGLFNVQCVTIRNQKKKLIVTISNYKTIKMQFKSWITAALTLVIQLLLMPTYDESLK